MTLETALTSFSIGLLAMTSPCVLPLYPGFLAYLSRSGAVGKGRYALGALVLGGVLVTMLALGALITALSVSVGQALAVAIPLADAALILFGLLLLMDVNPFKRLPQVRAPALRNPYLSAFLYGMLYGPLALPCSGPLVVSIFALSLTPGEAAGKLATFLWFGLGFGLPLLILSLLSGALQHRLTRALARHATLLRWAGGGLLVALGLYDLALNWEMLIAYWR